MKKRVGILGGTFNPPHIVHLMNATYVKEALQLDKVYLMPSATPPHKNGKQTIDSSHRLEMVRLAIADNDDLAIETYEVDKGGVNYTFNTMTALQQKYPDTEFFLIIGGDMVDDLATWYRVDDLVEAVTVVGIYRPGSRMETSYDILVVDCPPVDLSSSMIRERVSNGQSIRYLVTDNVIEYIEAKELYR